MPEPTDLPELIPPPARRPRWQFNLWWLFLLMTLVAAVAGVARFMSAIPWLAVGMAIYLLGFGGYLVLRLPWLMAHISPERRRVRENRRRLDQWAKQKRDS